MADDKDRPMLISLIAIIYFVIGVLTLLASAVILMASTVIPGLIIPIGIFAGLVAIGGLISLVIAGGFWNGWKIMWYLAVIFGILEIIGCLIMLFYGNVSVILALIIEALLLYYIFRPKVKEFFGL